MKPHRPFVYTLVKVNAPERPCCVSKDPLGMCRTCLQRHFEKKLTAMELKLKMLKHERYTLRAFLTAVLEREASNNHDQLLFRIKNFLNS